ncbi:fatty acid synthase-like [Episyrphus balteatus]|uniref:fatty acid synthase-like n=1 Tax=Episyrphus balteatus TaxID=286459 RepID=UPI002486727D|nr:fatty acid synthase-like [Episyrphus balteatus]
MVLSSENDIPRPDLSRPQYYRSHPSSKGDEIVISGMSGQFPKSDNIGEYRQNLYDKVDMLEEAEKRWKHIDPEIPKRCGRINRIDKFDATFFGVHHMQANTMDPQCRLILEEAYMAVMDAGINPNSIRGTRTGVYIASCFSESEKNVMNDPASQGAFAMTGCSRAMYANRISYSLGLHGPSLYLDTACSSSMYGLDVAYAALRSGEIDAAIVGGTNLILHPNATIHFARLGVLSHGGNCSPFDQKANGYVRSEGVAAIFLQRRRDACRIYGTLVHSKTNCDGYKAEGITYPSGKIQEKLLREFYNDIRIPADEIGYMEAHSTGTVVGDPEECLAIDNAICKQRTEPLLIGSVKSNIGHTEPTSGICSIVKVMFAFQSGMIPPNIHFDEPRKEIEALQEGRMIVVNEAMELKKPYVGVNSFGFGGANAHILLKQHEKKKIQGGIPEKSLPTLFLWSGRTKEAVDKVFNKLESKPLDAEYIALLHNVQNGGIPGMVFRGFNLMQGNGMKLPFSYAKEIEHFTGVKRPIVWVFSGMGSQWSGMGAALMAIPQFQQSIQRCYNALKPAGVDLIKILTADDPNMFDNILHSFVGIAATQIALVDILKSFGMEPDYIIGHSVGELGCAYADGCFTAEQMILAAYYRGKVSVEKKMIKGSMAAIGLSYSEIRGMLPESIEVACHNSAQSCTISGPCDDVKAFVEQLKAQNIFAREVACSNIAYHSRHIAHLAADLTKYLKHIVPNPKKRSHKWLSTSVPQKHWSRPESQMSSAEYHTNNVLGYVLFEETSALLPQNALTIEIAPHGLLQSILKGALPNGVHVSLTQRNNKDNHLYFLTALGKLHTQGLNVPVQSLYPKLEWPVSCGTDTISDIIEWDHRDDWEVYSYNKMISKKSGEKIFIITMKSEEFKYLEGHNIDGKILVPATYYLECVWKTFALMNHESLSPFERAVEFENVRFVRATTLTEDSKVELTVMIHYATGDFEIIEGESLVASGTVREIKDAKTPTEIPFQPFDTTYEEEFHMTAKDLYKELKLRGYYYNGAFRAIETVRGDGHVARLKWTGNWVTFMDCLLQTQILRKDSRELCVPVKIQKIRIFGRHHLSVIGNKKYIDVYSSNIDRRIVGGGVEIVGMEESNVQRKKTPGLPVLERYTFVPHFPSPVLGPEDMGRLFIQLALENVALSKLKIVEVIPLATQNPLIEHFMNAVEDLPLITGDYIVLSSNNFENLPSDVEVESGSISNYLDCNFIIDQTGGDILNHSKSLTETSFVVLVVSSNKAPKIPDELSTLAISPLTTSGLKCMLLRKKVKARDVETKCLKISSADTEHKWVKTAQETLQTKDLILYSQKDKHSGVLGLVNCLRKEYLNTIARCVIIDDKTAPDFDPQNEFYSRQLSLGLAINIFRNGQWGSYRHLQLVPNIPVKPQSGLVFANILHRGDLSSLKWLQGQDGPQNRRIKVVYSSLNFKDIMIATGRISVDIFSSNRLGQDAILGFEYSGIDTKTGKKIMGMCPKAAVANYIQYNSPYTMEVPAQWSLRDAATVPATYFTVYYAFFFRADIRKAKSILIHAGTGGVGLSAIRVAQAYGLEVFTTVSTVEKKNFLLKTFPKLKESNIGNSRDTSFETMIRDQTNGNGVDVVLNSLAEEKLVASLRCLGRGGIFLEIGKFDLANDSRLGLAPFLKELSFVSVLLDLLMNRDDPDLEKGLVDIVVKDIAKGIVVPLPTTVFPAVEMEQAFRYLASAKHIGKVLVQVNETPESPTTLPMSVLPTIYFKPDLVYVIPGGLGGFGLELVDWMVLRGARKIVLSSSRGISNGYQSYRVQTWKSYGCEVRISTANIAVRNGCEALIKGAMTLGPIGGIFNLAVVLKDAIFENQSVELFKESFGPKAMATKYLDELSRKMCPQLEHFVVFSSVSCGRGNVGQTNYGMANSIMERIIEDRINDGLPGKAIQWGAVGEVGLVAAMAEDKIDLEIGGTLQQRISSCLTELDKLLSCPDPLVASMVVAEKRQGQVGAETLLETVMNIMSIRDPKSVSYGSTLSELGMDSLMAVDIKQTLERNFDLFLSPQDLRALTFQKLEEYSVSRKTHGDDDKITLDIQDFRLQITTMVRNMGDEKNFDKTVVPINQAKKGKYSVFVFSGIECSSGPAWINLGKHIKVPAFIIQLHKTANMTSFDEIAKFALNEIVAIMKPNESYRLIGYSYGSIIVSKVANLLEELGYQGKILLIDGSPSVLSALFKSYKEALDTSDNLDSMILSKIVNLILPEESIEKTIKIFSNIHDFEGRMIAFQQYVRRQKVFSERYITSVTSAVIQRTRFISEIDLATFKRFNAPICLIKPSCPLMSNASKDYGLKLLTNNEVAIRTIEGNHYTVLENPELTQAIDEFMFTD